MRGKQVARCIKVAIRLSQRPMRLNEFGDRGTAAYKMAQRDILTLEEAGLPVYQDDERRYGIDAHFMKRFL